MMESFSQHLLEFARAVDFVDEQSKQQVIRMITTYAKHAFVAEEWGLYLRQMVRTGIGVGLVPGLSARQSSAQFQWSLPLKIDGRLSAQVSLASVSGKPLWITTRQKGPLKDADPADYVDELSGEPVIPAYSAAVQLPICTSIYLPILSASSAETGAFASCIGVLNLEATDYVRCSNALRQEAGLIAEALSLVWNKAEATEVSLATTTSALQSLDGRLQDSLIELHRQPLVGKPAIFVGMSERCEKDVLEIVDDCLREFKEFVDVYSWKEDYRTGNRHIQLWEQLERCTLGLFYLSEPSRKTQNIRDKDEPRLSTQFTDNLNVVFEAGAFRAARGGQQSRSAMIILRESSSDPMPFDLASEGRIDIQREGDWEDDLRARLTRQLQLLLQSDPKSAPFPPPNPGTAPNPP